MDKKQTEHLLNTERIPTVEAHYHLVVKMMMGRRKRRWKSMTQFGSCKCNICICEAKITTRIEVNMIVLKESNGELTLKQIIAARTKF